MYAVLTSQERS